MFLDYTGLASGDFESVILENINSRAHFLVLLSPSALERCGDPGDWLRREIEAALDSRRNIVPLMLEGFDFGTPTIASQLTGKLAALKQYNAMSVPPEYFDAAMAKLRNKFLNVPLNAVLQPTSPAARKAATQQKDAAATAPPVAQAELTAQQWFERRFKAKDPAVQVRSDSEAIRLQPDHADALINGGSASPSLITAQGSPGIVFASESGAIYSQPNTGQVVDSVAIGEELTVVSQTKDNYEVITNKGKRGYLAMTYASVKDPKAYFTMTLGSKQLDGYVRANTGIWREGLTLKLAEDKYSGLGVPVGDASISVLDIETLETLGEHAEVSLRGGVKLSGVLKGGFLFYVGDPAQLKAGLGTMIDLSSSRTDVALKRIEKP